MGAMLNIPDYTKQPLVIDLYCGLGGWAEGFLSEGYEVWGYDIEKHDYGTGTYPGKLFIRDVRSLRGAEFKDAAVIVASPPCQEPSYRAMPWSRAKALNKIGPPNNFIDLFNQCFRIQREASEAAGRYIPLIVENVRGAQAWVGRARWHHGSFYLWGDVPALMPITLSAAKTSGRSLDRNAEQKWGTHNMGRGDLMMAEIAHNAIKQGGDWLGGPTAVGSISRTTGSKSAKRKAASAHIAKIPFPLAQHIAKCFYPHGSGL